ncbi:MAG: hypothetical protein NVS3B17_09690 [Vulcanimicrobiaceae bacterium]
MMQSGNGTAVTAVFAIRSAGQTAARELKIAGYAPWLATKGTASSGDSPVATSSDGALGAIGRAFSGDRSLHRSLADHGVAEATARTVDAVLTPEGAVVVVTVASNVEHVVALLERYGGDVHGIASMSGRGPNSSALESEFSVDGDADRDAGGPVDSTGLPRA